MTETHCRRNDSHPAILILLLVLTLSAQAVHADTRFAWRILRGVPDIAGAGYSSWLLGTTLHNWGNRTHDGVAENDLSWSVAVASGLWLAGDAVAAAAILASSSQTTRRAAVWIQRVALVAAQLAVVSYALLSPFAEGSDRRGLFLTVSVPLLANTLLTAVPLP